MVGLEVKSSVPGSPRVTLDKLDAVLLRNVVEGRLQTR